MPHLIADLHIHSHYSIATSRDCKPETLYQSAVFKGIDLIGTGDFTHPLWREELKEKLIEDGSGVLKLKDEYVNKIRQMLPKGCSTTPRFLLTAELSCIYKQDGKVRKNHNLVILPTLELADKLSARLDLTCNIRSDGRPILGLSARNLLEICLGVSEDVLFIPAHIWTPHFSLFGSKTGFDRIEDCFGSLTRHIYALETGLSSDPDMNNLVSALDRFTLISNSDAHSPGNLGREANLFDSSLDYYSLYKILKDKDDRGFLGTLEFFPEEGKYHLDGHRNCGVSSTPEETRRLSGLCPKCGKPFTIGVLSRVEELSDRKRDTRLPFKRYYEHLVPLNEVLADCFASNSKSTKVRDIYLKLISSLDSEFHILREASLDDIGKYGGEIVREGISRLRNGKVIIKAGYDGEYGVIRLFSDGEIREIGRELFKPSISSIKPKEAELSTKLKAVPPKAKVKAVDIKLTDEQEAIIRKDSSLVAVIAGPGTGKTFTLAQRVVHAIKVEGILPDQILALTFTRRAANELKERLSRYLDRDISKKVYAGTFHSFALDSLIERDKGIVVIEQSEARRIVQGTLKVLSIRARASNYLNLISKLKNNAVISDEENSYELKSISKAYNDHLKRWGLLDYDDLLIEFNKLLSTENRSRFKLILIDEFQDLNRLQIEIAERLYSRGENKLFVIGDPNQSIYGFRGSNPVQFGDFLMKHKESDTEYLTLNHRSTSVITNASNKVLVSSISPLEKSIVSLRDGVKIRLLILQSKEIASIKVAHEIVSLTGGADMLSSDGVYRKRQEDGYKALSSLAVLSRYSSSLQGYANALRHEQIPYSVRGDDDFLDDSKVQEVLIVLRAILNPMHDYYLYESLKQKSFGISDNLLDVYIEEARKQGLSLFNQFNAIRNTNLEGFNEIYKRFSPNIGVMEAKKAIITLLETLKIETNEGLKRLISFSAGFDNLGSLFNMLSQYREGDIVTGYSIDAVQLLTIHASKGLEFDTVYICLNDDGFMGYKKLDIDEERRLFYVALTRAMERVNLILVRGREEGKEPLYYRFVKDIPKELMCIEEVEIDKKTKQLRLL